MNPPSAAARRLVAAAISQPDTLGDGDCERLHGDLMGQPVNTLTSLAYVAAGAGLAARTRRLPRAQRAPARWYAGVLAVTGAGSVAYHGPQFTGAQLFHDLPVVGLLGMAVGVPLVRWRRGEAMLPGWSAPLGAALVGSQAVAVAAYVAGRTSGPVCDPESLLQLHGLWHVASAAGAAVWGLILWPASGPGSDPASRPVGAEGEGDSVEVVAPAPEAAGAD